MNVLAVATLVLVTLGLGATEAGETIVRSSGNWNLKRWTSDTNHTTNCVLVPKQQSRIQVSERRLILSGLPRKSIFNYQYIIDDEPTSAFNFPSEEMQDNGSIYFENALFDKILNAGRLRVRILDKWHEAVAEDVDLVGLGELHKQMAETCQ